MTKDEALKMAIEAMNSAYSSHGKILTSNPAQDAWLYHGCDAKLFKALQACKEALEQPNMTYEDGFAHGYEAHRAEQALEQPAQEPYQCHWVEKGKGHCERNKRMGFADDYGQPAQEPVAWLSTDSKANEIVKTHPAPLWQGLSDDELSHLKYLHVDYELFDEGEYGTECNVYVDEFARAIEQALKEKNT